MKKLFQLCIILAISFAGELLAEWIPLPIPACIYGMVLMLAGLLSGLIPLAAVRDTGKFLLDIMPVMFIPAAVGLITTWGQMKAMLIPCILAIIPVTLLVMAVTGHVTQAVLRMKERRQKDAPNAD